MLLSTTTATAPSQQTQLCKGSDASSYPRQQNLKAYCTTHLRTLEQIQQEGDFHQLWVLHRFLGVQLIQLIRGIQGHMPPGRVDARQTQGMESYAVL
jgi:hypothetical protein